MAGRLEISGNLFKNNLYRSCIVLLISSVFFSCASVPRETVMISEVLGNDLAVLHKSHRELAALYFTRIKEDINVFVDEVYSPFVIHYVLKAEYDRHLKGEPTLFRSVEIAAGTDGIDYSVEALNTMSEFQQAAIIQIQGMRNELLAPVLKQEMQVMDAINASYEQAVRANITITGYLESVHKVKESQQKSLTMLGFKDADLKITNSLLNLSELVNTAVKKGKAIDIKGDNALLMIEEISNQLKNLTN